MPKTAAAAVPALAGGAGEKLGRSLDPIEAITHQRVRAPGQLGVLAVDPGDKHVGLAVGLAFATPDPKTGDMVAQDELEHAFEVGHRPGIRAIDVAVNAGWVDILVVEDWVIYKDKAAELVGSRCGTARMLGAIEHIVDKYNQFPGVSKVELVEQPATAQQDAMAKLQQFKMDRTSTPGQRHALSAELHWWFCVFNRRGLLD
jgi:hypothetical protein